MITALLLNLFLQAEMEMMWAMKAHHQAETYFKVLYMSVIFIYDLAPVV